MTAWLADPALQATLHLGFAALFLRGAAHKLADRRGFESALAGYELLSPAGLRAAAWLLIGAEGLVGFGLLMPGVASVAAGAGAGLLGLYALAMASAWRRGLRDIDCGCGSAGGSRPIGPDLAARNLVLMAGLLVAAWPAADRALVWLDVVTITAALLSGGLLFGAAERALAQARALAAWRRAWGVAA